MVAQHSLWLTTDDDPCPCGHHFVSTKEQHSTEGISFPPSRGGMYASADPFAEVGCSAVSYAVDSRDAQNQFHPVGYSQLVVKALDVRVDETDAECTVVATLYALAKRDAIDRKTVAQAIKDLGIDSEKAFPHVV